MGRLALAFFVLVFGLAACTPPPPTLGTDGKPLPRVYTIRDAGAVSFGMLDSVNALRQAAGVPNLTLNAQLTAAAKTHAQDMSLQNRPWHFGSDGSSPLQRVSRTGYTGLFKGEVISETFETEIETLAAWMEEESSRKVLLDPTAVDMGFSWHQEPNGRLWWVLNTATPGEAAQVQG